MCPHHRSDKLYCEEILWDIMAQSIQAYDIWLANELAFLKDIYLDKKILSMARVKLMKEWFAVIGAMLIFTQDVLDNAINMFEAMDMGKGPELSETEVVGAAGLPA